VSCIANHSQCELSTNGVVRLRPAYRDEIVEDRVNRRVILTECRNDRRVANVILGIEHTFITKLQGQAHFTAKNPEVAVHSGHRIDGLSRPSFRPAETLDTS
jgi:hypothetical protein